MPHGRRFPRRGLRRGRRIAAGVEHRPRRVGRRLAIPRPPPPDRRTIASRRMGADQDRLRSAAGIASWPPVVGNGFPLGWPYRVRGPPQSLRHPGLVPGSTKPLALRRTFERFGCRPVDPGTSAGVTEWVGLSVCLYDDQSQTPAGNVGFPLI
ncbi:hypothetical protein SPHINGOAX6_30311 [Sphingomonas sp. AX6]|nr:hypothetical protein SPHINGOAX6_30311 [Sphingomonas sp. AX6]